MIGMINYVSSLIRICMESQSMMAKIEIVKPQN